MLLDENDGTKWKLGRSKSKEESKGSSCFGETEGRLLVFLGAVEKVSAVVTSPHTSVALAEETRDNPLIRVLRVSASPLLRGLGGLLTHPHQ